MTPCSRPLPLQDILVLRRHALFDTDFFDGENQVFS